MHATSASTRHQHFFPPACCSIGGVGQHNSAMRPRTQPSSSAVPAATVSRHAGAPAQETGVIDTHRGKALEVVAPAAELLPGDVRTLREIPATSPLKPLLSCGLADEATLQLIMPPPQFVAMSNVGIVTFTRRRPIDVLKARSCARAPC